MRFISHPFTLLAAITLCSLPQSTGFAQDQFVPLDEIRPGAERDFNGRAWPEARPGPPLPAEFPEVRMSFPDEKIRAEFPQGDFREARPEVAVFEADSDGKIVLPDDGGTVWLAAIATTAHDSDGKLDVQAHWWHPITGEPIDAEELARWGEIEEGRDRFRRRGPKDGTQVALLFREEGVANLRWIGVHLFDAESLWIQSRNGRGVRDSRKSPAVFDTSGPMWNDGAIIVLLDFCYGEFAEASAPAEPGTILKLPTGAMAGLFHLHSGRQRGASYGYDEPSFAESVFIEPDPEKPMTIATCGFLPYEEGRITDLELVDRKGNVSVQMATGMNDYVFNAIFSGVMADEIVEFRAKQRPHRARMIVKVPKLHGMPNKRTEVSDALDQRIPFMKFGKVDDMTRFIGSVGHLWFCPSVKDRPGIDSLEFPRTYRDTTAREMMMEIESAAGQRFLVEPSRYRLELQGGN